MTNSRTFQAFSKTIELSICFDGIFQYFLEYICPVPGSIAEYNPARLGILTALFCAIIVLVKQNRKAKAMYLIVVKLFINCLKDSN